VIERRAWWPFAFDNGTGWQLTSGTLGAYSVLGKKL